MGPLKISDVTDNSATLSWAAPEDDGGQPLTGYLVEMRPSTRSSWMKAGSLEPTDTTFTVLDLLEGTEYFFRVTAINDEGHSEPLESKDTAKPKKKIGKYPVVYFQ